MRKNFQSKFEGLKRPKEEIITNPKMVMNIHKIRDDFQLLDSIHINCIINFINELWLVDYKIMFFNNAPLLQLTR